MQNIPSTMRAVQLTGHGGPEQLVYRDDVPVPEPGPGEFLIRVGAAGVNNTDLNTRLAWYSKSEGGTVDASWSGNPIRFPRIQGADVCGTVVATGPGADSTRIGQRVLVEPCLLESAGTLLSQPWYLGSECDGGFAEYTVAPARHCFALNTSLSDIELASFPCAYSTAENMLTRARVTADDLVLVTGASGGVGSAAVQLARARGARVVAVTQREKAAQMSALGAEQVLARETSVTEALGRNAVDVVIDLVAGPAWPELLDVLRPFGRYATAGAIAGAEVTLDVRTLYLKDLSLFGCTVLDADVFPNLVRVIESRAIQPLVARTFPLSALREAQQHFETKAYFGKIVIDVAEGQS